MFSFHDVRGECQAFNVKPSRDMTGDRDNIVTVRCEAVEPMPIRR
jgi:hypothetical protein